MSGASGRKRMPTRVAVTVWILLMATIVPVCKAEGLWVLAIPAGMLSAMGMWLTSRAGRPILSQRLAAVIALVLGGIAASVCVENGTIQVFPVANWLIAIAIVKCWQLGSSRDYVQILMIIGLLLLVGSLVSWQLGFAIALVLAVILAPGVIIAWHLMAEQERWARWGVVREGWGWRHRGGCRLAER